MSSITPNKYKQIHLDRNILFDHLLSANHETVQVHALIYNRNSHRGDQSKKENSDRISILDSGSTFSNNQNAIGIFGHFFEFRLFLSFDRSVIVKRAPGFL